jgi:hypothetical protein
MRLLFGSVENRLSTSTSLNNHSTTDMFNATEFETLRWKFHAPPVNMSYHGNPKVIMDVSAIPESYFSEEVVFSIHRPLQDFCKVNKELDYTKYYKQPLAANHYLGSWERYSARNDSRRSRDVYDSKAQAQAGQDDGISDWLLGFVDSIGPSQAAQLLSGKYLSNNSTETSMS